MIPSLTPITFLGPSARSTPPPFSRGVSSQLKLPSGMTQTSNCATWCLFRNSLAPSILDSGMGSSTPLDHTPYHEHLPGSWSRKGGGNSLPRRRPHLDLSQPSGRSIKSRIYRGNRHSTKAPLKETPDLRCITPPNPAAPKHAMVARRMNSKRITLCNVAHLAHATRRASYRRRERYDQPNLQVPRETIALFCLCSCT
jgi:hypothetical protein